jgi:LEA14-like dessication related protein
VDDSIETFPVRLARTALAAALAFVLAGAGCSAVFQKPELEFRGLRVNSIGLGGASLDVVVDVYNPNSFRLGVDRFTYDLTVENVHFGTGETNAPVSVEGRGTATVRLPLDLDWSRLGDVGRSVLGTGTVGYGISGEMTVVTGFGKRRVPYAKSGRLSILGSPDT